MSLSDTARHMSHLGMEATEIDNVMIFEEKHVKESIQKVIVKIFENNDVDPRSYKEVIKAMEEEFGKELTE